jgi:feruloyl esterase
MKVRFASAILSIAMLSGALIATRPASAAGQQCDSLAMLKLPDATITGATLEPAGPFTPPAPPGVEAAAQNRVVRPIDMPSFCRVEITVKPAVRIEVWMPASGWNGNFEGIGGGGYVGNIGYAGLGNAVKAGYAAGNTDTGHVGGTADFALGHPELVTDFAYRAVHEMTLKSKAVVEAFYGKAPARSYYNGCSQGGRQGLEEAQKFPADYDGIVSGAPAVYHTAGMIRNIAAAQATLGDPDAYVPAAKLPAIQAAAFAQCDQIDGLKDGLIDDPRKCHFDTSVLLCKAGESDSCLTAKQITGLNALYADAKDGNGKLIYPGRFPGAESGWTSFVIGTPGKGGSSLVAGIGYMRFFIFNDPNWDYKTFDWSKDPQKAMDNPESKLIDAPSPDLKAFHDRGGKLIMYQGWGDEAVAPMATLHYYKEVVATSNGGKADSKDYETETEIFDKAAAKTGDFYRLFMAPGMDHCFGGPGPNVFDHQAAMVNWVENKQPPEKIIATHSTKGTVDRTRPLCAYPMTAQYSGSGSIDDAANFVCKMPPAAK